MNFKRKPVAFSVSLEEQGGRPMSEERRNPHNPETDESGLLLSVEPSSERSLDFAALSDDTDNVDTDTTDAEDTTGDTDGTDDTDATDVITADDADGSD